MRKIKEVLRLRYELKLDQRQIARSCSISVSTVHEYLRRAERAKVSWPLPDGWDDAHLEAALYPCPEAKPQAKKSPPDFAAIHEQLRSHRHVTMQLLWEEYREANPDGYRYSRFCELYQRWRKKLDVVMRQEHKAGRESFHRLGWIDDPHLRPLSPAWHGKPPCSSPRSAPVPTLGRKPLATSRWKLGCALTSTLSIIGAAFRC